MAPERSWPRMRAPAEHRQQAVAIATMGAALPAAGVVGAKVYTTIDGRYQFVIVLFSAITGEPLAVLEANEITRLRTAAVTAVAMQRLAAREARALAIFGTGVQARAHAEALLMARPFERVLVAGAMLRRISPTGCRPSLECRPARWMLPLLCTQAT